MIRFLLFIVIQFIASKQRELAFELNISFELSSLWQSVSEFSGSGEGSPFEDLAFKI